MAFSAFLARRLRAGSSQSSTGRIIRFAIGTIALCMTVILLAHALILGFKEEIKAKVFGFWGHIHITAHNLNQTFETAPVNRNQTFYPGITQRKHFPVLADGNRAGQPGKLTRGGVDHIQVFGLKPGILARKGELEGILLKGVGADFKWDFMGAYLTEGDTLSLKSESPPRDIMISRTTAGRMKVNVGDDLLIHFIQGERQVERKFRVRAVYKTGLEEYDRKFAIVDIRHLQELAGWSPDTVSGFELFVEDLGDAEAIADYIYYEWPLPGDLYIETIRQKFPAIFDWVEIQDINERVLLILMLLVVMINLATVLLILMLERYGMIGVLKALGASDWTVRWIFIRLTLRILVIGMLLGNGLALGLGSLQRKTGWFRLDESEYYLSEVPIHWDPGFFFFINVFVLLVAGLTLLLPSIYIARIQPVNAIRFK